MLHQSFRRDFVLTTGKLAATGAETLNLGVGQLGIFQTSSYKAISNPTYPAYRELFFALGKKVNDEPALMGGFPNEGSYKSEIVMGSKIIDWRGSRAHRGDLKEIISIGWDGSDSNKSITINEEATRYVTVNVWGPAVTKFISPDGVTAEFFLEGPCAADPLQPGTAPCYNISKKLADDINAHKELQRYIRATAKFSCNPALDAPEDVDGAVDCESWEVTIPDGGANAPLSAQALVQSQNPTKKVTVKSTDGVYTTYSIVQLASEDQPDPVTNAGATVLPNCTTCPANYNYVGSGFVYTVSKTDAGDAGALTDVKSDYGITGSESGVRTSYSGGTSTYLIVSATPIDEADGSDVLTFVSENTTGMCLLEDETTYSWVAGPTSIKWPKVWYITLADDACGTDYLATMQAQYAGVGTVALVTDGDCTKKYSLTTLNDCFEVSCYTQPSQWTNPQSFRSYTWEAAPEAAEPDDCKCGVFIETIWTPEFPSDDLMDYDNIEYDTVHIQASTYSKDWNDPSGRCAADIPVTRLKYPTYPQGLPSRVRANEEKSRQYELEYRDEDMAVRAAEGYRFNTQQHLWYDHYALEFEVGRLTGGWGQETKERCTLNIWVPTGQGKELETAVNTYLDSAGIKLPPVVL